MTAPVQAVQLVDRYANRKEAIWQRVITSVVQLFIGAGNDFREDDASRFVTRALPLVTAGQRQTSALVDAYMTSQVRLADKAAKINGIDFDSLTLRQADMADVYRRPFQQLWYDLSQGKPFVQARDQAANRLRTITETDLQLAERSAEQASMEKLQVTGYRRVIHPEMSRTGSCILCAIASDQRYNVETLRPIHPNCHCTVSPIIGDFDPGQELNAVDLDALYKAQKEEFSTNPDGSRVRIAVRENGELGPVLVNAADNFSKAPS